MNLRELGKTPIRPENPAGEDVRFAPEFEALQGEIDRTSNISGGATDWGRIVQMASGILEKHSKDLLVASYLCLGLLRRDGLKGLADGIRIYRDLMENFWEPLFPAAKRMRARRNAVEWLMEKVSEAAAGLKPERWPPEQREEFLSDLRSIDRFLGEKMEEAPVLEPLIHSLASLAAAEPEKAPPPPEESAAPPASRDRRSEAAPAASAPLETDDPAKLLQHGLEILNRVEGLLSQKDPLDPLRFRLNRLVAWLPLNALPPGTEGKTMIPAPDGQIVSILNGLYQSGNWRNLLEAAEGRVLEFRFWFDLSRYASESLEKLGHPEAARGIGAETLFFTQRLAGVERLAFADGMPFADPQTRDWLKGQMPAGQGGGGGLPADEAAGGLSQKITDELTAAQERIKKGKMAQALNIFKEKRDRAGSGRERFFWSMAFCRLLNQAKQPRICSPYWEEILSFIDFYKLDQWDPELAVEGLSTVLGGMKLLASPKDETRAAEILSRIGSLNPGRALDLL